MVGFLGTSLPKELTRHWPGVNGGTACIEMYMLSSEDVLSVLHTMDPAIEYDHRLSP